MTCQNRRSARAPKSLSLALAAGVLGLAVAGSSFVVPAQADDASQGAPCVSGPAATALAEVVDDGHFDFGARLKGDALDAVVKDDRSSPGSWKSSESLIFALSDASAKQKMPAGMEKIAPAGSDVFMIGATQVAGVPWLGWNTQDQGLAEHADGDVTMTLDSFDGPGDMSVFLSGNFGSPGTDVFSTKGQKSYRVPLHTHQHGNWVFTRPGHYTATVSYSVNLKDGRQVKATGMLRFAVGDQAVEEARANPGTVASATQKCEDAGGASAERSGAAGSGPGHQAAQHGAGDQSQGTTADGVATGGGSKGAAGGQADAAGQNPGQLAETGPREDAMIVCALFGITFTVCGALVVRTIRRARRSV
ncbi:TIGR03773 family transporter-associated surface protein [Rothia koreensis]|uniref:TIGR03773 family transporter-associated surface protein n=1 Tax=Rothia koreensis TaxID=592378 RepID=UPI003FCD14E5